MVNSLLQVAWTNKKRHGRGEADVLRGQEGARMRDLHLWTALEAEKLQMRKDRSWRYRTCAVVGNSGQLLRAEAGAEIDQHDAVFRINYAPTAGFEAHVGNRTTFDIINQQHAKVQHGHPSNQNRAPGAGLLEAVQYGKDPSK
eukprot:gene2932-3746_t